MLCPAYPWVYRLMETKVRVMDMRIDAPDWAIEALVYELYGLSDDEVRAVGWSVRYLSEGF